MDKTLLVMVFVPTTDAADTDYHGLQGQIGTGYPVGPDLILTARHLLDPQAPKRRDARYPIKVRWHSYRAHQQAGPDGWVAIPDTAVICPECETLDAMLLRCLPPDGAPGWGILSEEAPTDQMQWSSEGFPDAGDYQDERHPCSFGGSCFSKAPDADYFELVAAAPPAGEDDWRGASGMPIFVGRRILGVARQVPMRFGSQRLHATPARRLLADRRFREALGFDERQARVAKARGELSGVLAPSPAALDALAKALGCEGSLAGLADPGQRAERVAACLLDTDIRSAIESLRQAHRGAGPAAAEPLVKSACLVVPALFLQGVVLDTKGLLKLALVPLPAGTRTVAELIMAGVDGRPALFRPREREDDQPAGTLSLPLPPEQGIGVGLSASLAAHLDPFLDPGREAVAGRRSWFDDYLLGTFDRSEPGAPVRQTRERIERTADLLEARRRDTGQTYYMVFFLPDDLTARARVEALVADLKRDYPPVTFLGLDSAFNQERADRRLVDPFCRMLPLRPQTPGDPGP
ncbi:hypothetical protein [uncultured Thiodictyon sp.]|uniref:hypothetical protein n=1 Tax=uncultured Thiodictyon sp. TaxID=1846217 RepID=UPI0025CFF3BA|nr:hypothetical protein [uncultured Thiodictyon sp.]